MKDGPETLTDDVKSLSGLLNHQDGGGVSTILMVMSGVRPGRLNTPVVFLSALPFPVRWAWLTWASHADAWWCW